ncbi:MAG TPA: hypothetical protein VJT75_08620 [Thermoleophilaceae bacterium]|nr:hypothetical protein [Thermoleophilaceae bacterium]
MNERLRIYTSGDPDEVAQLEVAVGRAVGVAVEVVPEARLLVGRVQLPFIETPSGRRHFGMPAVEQVLAETARGNGGGSRRAA